jgi:hypothetical protein
MVLVLSFREKLKYKRKTINSLEFGDKTEIILLTKVVQKVVPMTNAIIPQPQNESSARIEQVDHNLADRAFCIDSVEFAISRTKSGFNVKYVM